MAAALMAGVPCVEPQMEGMSCLNHWIWVLRGPLFQILSAMPSDWKKPESMVVAPMIAMFAPFLKSAPPCFDGFSSGSPYFSAARQQQATTPDQHVTSRLPISIDRGGGQEQSKVLCFFGGKRWF